jgi:hypothetical protein
MENPISAISSIIESFVTLCCSIAAGIYFFLTRPTTAALVISRKKNPLIPFFIFQSLALFPLILVSDLYNFDIRPDPLISQLETLKLHNLIYAGLFFIISFSFVSGITRLLLRRELIFRAITRPIQNVYGFVLLTYTVVALGIWKLLQWGHGWMQAHAVFIFNHLYLAYMIGLALDLAPIAFLGIVSYGIVARSKTPQLSILKSLGVTLTFVIGFLFSLVASMYLYLPIHKSDEEGKIAKNSTVERFVCLAKGNLLVLQAVLKNEGYGTIIVNHLDVHVGPKNDSEGVKTNVYVATKFYVLNEANPRDVIVIFPNQRMYTWVQFEVDDRDKMTNGSCFTRRNPELQVSLATDKQEIVAGN